MSHLCTISFASNRHSTHYYHYWLSLPNKFLFIFKDRTQLSGPLIVLTHSSVSSNTL